MRFSKRKLSDIPCCYAVASSMEDGRRRLLFAAEADGPCVSFDAEDFCARTVWDHPGGTMSLVPIGDGEFLAVQRFYPGFDAKNAGVVRAVRSGLSWRIDPFFPLPYIHRFDVLERGGCRYLLCCTVCSDKRSIDDWSSPGALYAAGLPDDPRQPIHLVPIADGMTRNHGYCRVEGEGFTYALTACDQGVFTVFPPVRSGGGWTVKRVMDRPVSDIALCDIDGDGVPELVAIEPFHGERFAVYRPARGGFQEIYEYPRPLAFAHVVWGGLLRGEPAIIGGCRGSDRDLFVLRSRSGRIVSELIETGAGPSNIAVVNGPERDLIAVANREIGEAAVFTVED